PATSVRSSPSAEPLDQTPAAEPLGDFVPQVTLDQAFVVAHSRDVVWAFFSRPTDVAACLPGASITGAPDDRAAAGKTRLKVGPITAEFRGRAEIDRDPSTWSGTIQGAGQDARSSSATRGVIRYHLLPGDAGSTRVALTVGYTLTGPLAQFSRSGLVREIASSLTKTFAQTSKPGSPHRTVPHHPHPSSMQLA